MAAVTAALLLAACRPADSGVDRNAADPTSSVVAEPSTSATPYSMDDY